MLEPPLAWSRPGLAGAVEWGVTLCSFLAGSEVLGRPTGGGLTDADASFSLLLAARCVIWYESMFWRYYIEDLRPSAGVSYA